MIVQGFAAKDECPPTAALHYEVFVRLLHLVEQRRNGQCNMPPARLVGAAALFELLDGRQSVRWVCQRSPFGEVRDGANMQRVHRLAMIMRSEAALHRWVMLPTLHTEINHLSISMRRIVDQAATEMVHTIWFTPEPISTQLLVTPLTSPLSQPSAPAPSSPESAQRQPLLLMAPSPPCECAPLPAPTAKPPSPPLPPTVPPLLLLPPRRTRLRMLTMRQLRDDASAPPELLGVETSGPTYAAVRTIMAKTGALLSSCAPPSVLAVVLWGDPSTTTVLNKFQDIVPGGTTWHAKQKKLRIDMSWVWDRTSATPLLWHDSDEPLFVFHADRASWKLTLDIVKGGSFLDVFPRLSVERMAIAKYEAAIAVGTVDALLSVPLNEHYTLREALKAGATNYQNRHGQMHVKWMTHALSVNNAHSMMADDRVRPWRNPQGEPMSPKAALWNMVRDFAPFAAKIYYATVPLAELLEAHVLARIVDGLPFSYLSATFYADGGVADELDGLRQWCNTKARTRGDRNEANIDNTGWNKGMDLHVDGNSGFTIVLVIGVLIRGFAQLYPTCGVALPLACWAWTSSNARDLLHAVEGGRGVRIGLVYTVHTAMATGVAPGGYEVAWDLGVKEAAANGPLEKDPMVE